MQRESPGAAMLQQGSQNGALPISQGRAAHLGSRVCAQNGFGGVLVETGIILGRESTWTSTIFANIGLGNFDWPVIGAWLVIACVLVLGILALWLRWPAKPEMLRLTVAGLTWNPLARYLASSLSA